MTKLEEEIKHAIINTDYHYEGGERSIEECEARAAAEVAKKYIKSAFIRSCIIFQEPTGKELDHQYLNFIEKHMESWLKENGITE